MIRANSTLADAFGVWSWGLLTGRGGMAKKQKFENASAAALEEIHT
jgi:hypothetical protein